MSRLRRKNGKLCRRGGQLEPCTCGCACTNAVEVVFSGVTIEHRTDHGGYGPDANPYGVLTLEGDFENGRCVLIRRTPEFDSTRSLCIFEALYPNYAPLKFVWTPYSDAPPAHAEPYCKRGLYIRMEINLGTRQAYVQIGTDYVNPTIFKHQFEIPLNGEPISGDNQNVFVEEFSINRTAIYSTSGSVTIRCADEEIEQFIPGGETFDECRDGDGSESGSDDSGSPDDSSDDGSSDDSSSDPGSSGDDSSGSGDTSGSGGSGGSDDGSDNSGGGSDGSGGGGGGSNGSGDSGSSTSDDSGSSDSHSSYDGSGDGSDEGGQYYQLVPCTEQDADAPPAKDYLYIAKAFAEAAAPNASINYQGVCYSIGSLVEYASLPSNWFGVTGLNYSTCVACRCKRQVQQGGTATFTGRYYSFDDDSPQGVAINFDVDLELSAVLNYADGNYTLRYTGSGDDGGITADYNCKTGEWSISGSATRPIPDFPPGYTNTYTFAVWPFAGGYPNVAFHFSKGGYGSPPDGKYGGGIDNFPHWISGSVSIQLGNGPPLP